MTHIYLSIVQLLIIHKPKIYLSLIHDEEESTRPSIMITQALWQNVRQFRTNGQYDYKRDHIKTNTKINEDDLKALYIVANHVKKYWR